MTTLFPRDIAPELAFCNRITERQRIRKNIEERVHTLIVSPRRYGKTSLALVEARAANLPYAHIDLFLALSAERVLERLLTGVSELVSQILPATVKAANTVKNFFLDLNISLSVGKYALGFKIERNTSTQKTLWSVFKGLEALLEKYNRSAVVFIDEIQDVLDAEGISEEFEAALRFIAQTTQYIRFVFSGSNRRLLKKIFEDRSRPLYKICDRMHLGRISEASYTPFLQERAQKKWQRNIRQSVLDRVFELAECHSYYMNALCSKLWRFQNAINLQDVNAAWEELSREEMSDVAADLSRLTPAQRQVLLYIARKGCVKSMNTKDAFYKLKLTPRGITQSLSGLLLGDYVEEIEQGYRVVDPLIKYFLISN